ncbi:MAG TPA: type II toxin-antitoxin system HicA family toxin [Candidatus Bilamarchaeaceae archaeon]|nr:type II toxin-antitoxin system HicA family toxin [Candidatus Bilamarchaeaceae archaeon]
MKLGPIPHKKLISILSSLGYVAVRQSGSHLVLKKDDKSVVVPIHSKEIGPGLLRMIVKEIGISREKFFELLKKA